MEQKQPKESIWSVLRRLLTNGFESGYPTAKDKRGKVHCLLEEGFEPAIVGRGDDYEAIIAREGKPKL